MLDSGRRIQVVNALAQLPCQVQVPRAWAALRNLGGVIPTTDRDRRRFPRHLVRHIAGLKYTQSLPAVPRKPGWHRIYLQDISRGGIGFLHFEQLYRGERMPVLFVNGKTMLIEVARSRRIRECCFSVGASFVADSANNIDCLEVVQNLQDGSAIHP